MNTDKKLPDPRPCFCCHEKFMYLVVIELADGTRFSICKDCYIKDKIDIKAKMK